MFLFFHFVRFLKQTEIAHCTLHTAHCTLQFCCSVRDSISVISICYLWK